MSQSASSLTTERKSSYKLFKEIEEKLDINWEDMFQRYVSQKSEKKGNNIYIPCPFHSENSPSFGINFQKKHMKCFGCGKYYGSILLFLKDYKGMRTNEMINFLIEDWYIANLSVLGETLDDYIEYDIKRTLYNIVNNDIDTKDPVLRRVLCYMWGIGHITQKKIDRVKDIIEKKYKKQEKQYEIAKRILREVETNKNYYALIFNEFNNTIFYRGLAQDDGAKKAGKYSISIGDKKEIMYLGNNVSLQNKITQVIGEKDLLQNIQTSWEQSYIQKFLETKSKEIYNKWFNKYIDSLYPNLTYKEYYESLLQLFVFPSDDINVSIGEGYFDMYFSQLFTIPFFSHGTVVSSGSQCQFINNVSKKLSERNQKTSFLVMNDYDKAGLLATIKFINNYIKTTKYISNKDTIDLKFFHFKTFNARIKKYLTIISELTRLVKKEWDTDIIERFKKIHKHYDCVFWYSVSTGLFEIFENSNTNYDVIKQIKKKYQPNYSEDDKWNNIIKDAGDITYVVNAIMHVLNLLYKSTSNKANYLYLKEFIIGEFKRIYNASFVNYHEIGGMIAFAKEDGLISDNDLNFLQIDGNYIYNNSNKSTYKMWLIKGLEKHLGNMKKYIDLETNYLVLFNFLDKDKKISELVTEHVLIKREDKERISKEIMTKPLVIESWYKRMYYFLSQMNIDDSYDIINIKLILYTSLLATHEKNTKEYAELTNKLQIVHAKLLQQFCDVDTNKAIEIAKNEWQWFWDEIAIYEKKDLILIINDYIQHYNEIKNTIKGRIQLEIQENAKEGTFYDGFVFDMGIGEFVTLAEKQEIKQNS